MASDLALHHAATTVTPVNPVTTTDMSFEHWYRDEYAAMVAAVAATTGNRHLAEDVVSEAFARAYARWATVQHMQAPLGWVYRTAINETRSLFRRRNTARRYEHRLPAPPAPDDPAATAGDHELWDAVAALSDRARQAIVLRYVLDLEQSEIATVLRVSRGTIATTLHRARRQLHDQLRPAGQTHEADSNAGLPTKRDRR